MPPAELMSEWEKDYAEIQEQMIAGESVSFTDVMRGIVDVICNQ
jgi:hypothetical protein